MSFIIIYHSLIHHFAAAFLGITLRFRLSCYWLVLPLFNPPLRPNKEVAAFNCSSSFTSLSLLIASFTMLNAFLFVSVGKF